MFIISCDIWQTLVKPNQTFSDTRAQIVSDFYGLGRSGPEFRPFIKQACEELDTETDRTGVQYGFVSRVRLALEKFGFRGTVTDEDLASVYARVREVQLSSLDNMPSLTEANLPEVFKRLTVCGFRIAVISNTGMTEGAELTEILDALGLGRYIDYHIYSDEVGVAKPNKGIFESLFAAADCAPFKVLHVGDNVQADFEGALMAGCGAALYDPNRKHLDNPVRYNSHSELLTLGFDHIDRLVTWSNLVSKLSNAS